MAVIVKPEMADSHVAQALIRELSVELGAMYGDEGDGGFVPADAMLPRSVFLVAWVDDQPAGCGALRPMEDASIGEIKRMFVRQPMRGQGISRHLLEALEANARQFGYTRLKLETGVLQPQAIGLYESAGFYICPCYGEYKDDPLSVCYEKTLIS
ncbi:GNAT family N-acetyltransferase [Phototrophicus methaneseepsis]|uniref:GNAT family N-acetyltransferase n=1 Tax=Phototrophicus methaneseepsis TaxID=2710758 RepID=A0A7S8IEU3_9CHLR|nr:GNAT family N-acetyltransferase [Phototrophicus methaneseepsis]QPC82951.1 GNAT family N-acetyltransferase [Phototrophicus methaneseepsis]